MAKKKRSDLPAPSILERLRHPSTRAQRYTALAIALIAALYLTISTIRHGRDLLPKSHDEHSYAIQTQMIARGRLWMPQHELADFFESFQMLARPVYASIYFPGSALMYAPGVWLSLPVWVMPVIVSSLSVALAYLLATRLIDGLAGLVVALLVLATHWFRLNATLVMSQSPMMLLGLGLLLAWLKWREMKRWPWAAAIGACAGWAAIIRPVDALAFAIPVGVAILLDFRRLPMRDVALTCATVVIAAVPFLSLQPALNEGTTGNFTRAPHTLYLEQDQPKTTYGFHDYDPHARPTSSLAQKIVYYRGFMLPDVQKHRPGRLAASAWERMKLTADVALLGGYPSGEASATGRPFRLATALLLVLLVAGLFRLNTLPRRVVAAVPLVFFVLYLPYTFYMEHYLIPILVPLLLLVLFGIERIASLSKHVATQRSVAAALTALLVVAAIASLPEVNSRVRDDRVFARVVTVVRDAIRDNVRAPAIVLVRYHPAENPHEEPVYNAAVAWPDDAPVIVAHDLGPRNIDLIRYYERVDPGRQYWLFDRRGFERDGLKIHAISAVDVARALAAAEKPTTGRTTP